ncbi:MAG TPA: AsmA family protein [Candidatus Binatia bacterium]
MRKWILIPGVVLLVLIVVPALALVNLNSLINRNKDYLLARAEEALGRKVAVGEIGVTLWGGIGVRLKQFSLADDPSFAEESFVRAADLQVNMKLLPLLRKELQVSKVILHRPVINVIRDGEGRFNFSTIGGHGEKKGKEAKKEKEKKERREERAAAPPLLVSLVDIDDGEIRYRDIGRGGIDFRATRLDFKIKDASLHRPIDVELEAAVFGAAKQNLKLKGRVGPVGPKADFSNLPVEGNLDLDSIALADLEKILEGFGHKLPKGLALSGSAGAKSRFSGRLGKEVFPEIYGTLSLNGVSARLPEPAQPITDLNAKVSFTRKTAELPETGFRIGGSQVRLAAKVASFAPLNLSYRVASPELNLADLKGKASDRKKPEVVKDLKGEGTVLAKDGAVTARAIFTSASGTIADGDYTNLNTATSLADKVATIESLSLGAFGGALKAKGRYDMRETTPRFAAVANVKAMDLTQIFRAFVPTAPQNLRGLIDMDLDVTGSGKEWSAIQKTLKGQGKAEVVNGALLDVNLAESVMSNIPGGVNIVPADIRKKYPAIFSAKDTEFKQMKGSAAIADGKAHTEDLVVSATEFETQGKGWFAFDRKVDFRALLFFSQQLSQDIISKAREAKGLANEQGRIEIPFTLSGKLPGAKPKPDMGYIARAMQKGFMERGMESFTRKKSGKQGSETSSADGESSSDSKRKKKRSPQEEIFRGLEQLFGK